MAAGEFVLHTLRLTSRRPAHGWSASFRKARDPEATGLRIWGRGTMERPGIATRTGTEPATLVLATDLDGTFAGGTAEDRRRLQRRLAADAGTMLLYVTGRSVPAARELMAESGLPRPELLIADVGTTVVDGGDFAPVEEMEEFLTRNWPGGAAIRERLAGMPGIVEQDVEAPRRVSYWLEDAPMEETVARVAEALNDLRVEVIGSADQYVDVLPRGVNKGRTLLEVLDRLGQPRERVVVAGDTLNDLALFRTGLRGVVVGNAEPALKRRVGERPHVYLADGAGAAGVLEGLLHFEAA